MDRVDGLIATFSESATDHSKFRAMERFARELGAELDEIKAKKAKPKAKLKAKPKKRAPAKRK